MEAVTTLTVLLVLAFLTESTVEYIFGGIFDTGIIQKIALAVGMAVAVVFNVDALRDFLHITSSIPYAGQIATGLIIGRGSSFVHDLYGQYLKPQPL